MAFFINRTENQEETKIIFSKAAVYYYSMWLAFVTWVLAYYINDTFYIATFIAVIVMLVFAMPFWKTTFAIKKSMKNRQVIVSGSKYSFRNPLTYVIK